ncbi:MAG TPA: TonB-dependent receptor [Pseudomonadales bacterium]
MPMVLATVLALLAPSLSFAEPDPELETITVTAHRIRTDRPVLPVLTRTTGTGPAVGADALRSLPSLAISQAGSLGSVTQVRVRGSEANHLMVLMDGVELADPATDASFNFANLSLTGTTRVELLAGAHSAIWGSDAVAGVLNFITKPTERRRRLSLEGGSFDTRQAALQLADTTGSYHYNLALSEFRTDGTNIATTGEEDDGFDQSSYRLSGGYRSESWTIEALVHHLKSDADFDPIPFPAFQPRDGDRVSKHDEYLGSVAATWHGDERFEQQIRLSYFDTDNRSFADGARESRTAAARFKATSLTRLRASSRHAVTLMLEHEKERFEQRGAPSIFGDPNQNQSVRTNSLALEYLWAPLDDLSLALSARTDDNSDFENKESYRAAARYRLTGAVELWANWGTGIKNPSFVERFGFTPDTFLGNPDLDPETNRHLSAGAVIGHRQWTLRATAFRDRLEDEINGFYFDGAAGAFTSINEPGTSKRDGVEVETTLAIPTGVLSMGASWLDAAEPDAAREIRRPQWQAYATVSHERGPFSAELSGYYVGNREDLDFSGFPAERVRLGDYVLLRAHLAYRLGRHLKLALRGENLLDESYQDQLGYASPGRAVYLQVAIDL